jgi:hypothetical protein
MSRLDRQSVIAMALLVVIAVAANLDRFVLGPAGVLRAHDLADFNVTSFAACSQFWRSGLAAVWDPMQLRGWTMLASVFDPQSFGCVIAAGVSPSLILPLVETVLLSVMIVGTFLFLLLFLEHSREVAVAGAILSVVLYYFFHEHVGVTSATLLPALIGLLSLSAAGWPSRLLMVVGALLIAALSNPYNTVIVMPLGHAILIFAGPDTRRRQHVIRWCVFWSCYTLYYSPTVVAHVQEFALSSRSLFHGPAVQPDFLLELRERFGSAAILSPAAVLISLISRRSIRATILMLLALAAIVVLSAANQVYVVGGLGAESSTVAALSTLYYRLFYLGPVVMLIWAAALMRHAEPARWWTYVVRAGVVCLFCYLVDNALSDRGRLFEPFWGYALAIGLSMGIAAGLWARRPWAIVLVGASVLLFSRYTHAKVWEVPFQGNLFVESPPPASTVTPSRTVTVMTACSAVDLFPAQALVLGQEALDGNSNFFDRSFAERWRYYIADNPSLCTARFAGWNNRADLTLADLKSTPDRILAWLRINNVEFLRSATPLADPALELIDSKPIPVDGHREITRYHYRLRSPVSRVFTIDGGQARRAVEGGLAVEEQVMYELLDRRGVTNVDLTEGSAARLRFSGAFDPSSVILTSINFHPGWSLVIDGQRAAPLERGAFGMLSARPEPGQHTYELTFRSGVTWWVPAAMLGAVVLLWFGVGLGRPDSVASSDERRAFRRATILTLGALIIIVAAGLAFVLARSAPKQPEWLDAAWGFRRAVTSLGTTQTAPIAGFPLRVEFSAADTEFWNNVGANGSDLRFTDAGGRKLLAFEIEEFDAPAKSMIAWVRLPELAPTGQRVAYVYFGNPAATAAADGAGVWDAAFEGVWHLNPRAIAKRGLAHDSTGCGHHGELRGNLKASALAGGTGVMFGAGDWIEMADSPAWQLAGTDWTLEFSIEPKAVPGNFGVLEHGPGDLFHLYRHGEGFLVLERRNGTAHGDISFAKEQVLPAKWTTIALARTHERFRIGINGVYGPSYPAGTGFVESVVSAPLRLGAGAYASLEGRLAEVRLSKGLARSADWVLASARALAGQLVRFGSVEARPAQ